MTSADYLQQLRSLAARGRLWVIEVGSVFHALLDGISQEPARVDLRALDLLEEADPRTTLELLPDWERVAGLPDPDVPAPAPGDINGRRAALVAKLTKLGGQSRQFFIDLAAALGYPITITEFRPFTCISACDTPCYQEPWWFAWQVNAALNNIREADCESPCDDPLRSWGNETLEAVINRWKPAHTSVIYSYT